VAGEYGDRLPEDRPHQPFPIYPNDGFECAPNISRINRQIRHFPHIVIGFGERVHAFANSVLMAS